LRRGGVGAYAPPASPERTDAIIREDGRSIYFVIEGAEDAAKDPWVIANVLPILKDCPEPPWTLSRHDAAGAIQLFLNGDDPPVIVSDWPDDLRHFCDLIVFGPGQMIGIPALRMEVARVDAYPTALPGAVQHNAWWDALALRERLDEVETAAAEEFLGSRREVV
jgi:hypothetical protein